MPRPGRIAEHRTRPPAAVLLALALALSILSATPAAAGTPKGIAAPASVSSETPAARTGPATRPPTAAPGRGPAGPTGQSLLRASVPEFLGALAAGTVLAAAGWTISTLRARHTRRSTPPRHTAPPDDQTEH
ncbi:hypothetical protein ACFPH6_08710 [Streptomyces xiangluensis]|uniref:Cobalt/nickel transport protein n=1 Tax=Streptomyces xiangluensis TaxID=2665720 RepID=A0ABV8YKJ0_9ACTN